VANIQGSIPRTTHFTALNSKQSNRYRAWPNPHTSQI